jgi:hypothetical protein
MKKHITVSLALLVAGITQAQTTKFETEGASISRVLAVYSKLSGKELVIESSATNQLKTITMHVAATKALTEAEAAKVIESELRKQADIVITPLDDKRVSVNPRIFLFASLAADLSCGTFTLRMDRAKT